MGPPSQRIVGGNFKCRCGIEGFYGIGINVHVTSYIRKSVLGLNAATIHVRLATTVEIVHRRSKSLHPWHGRNSKRGS